MKFYHATPKRNLESIQTHGLDPSFSQGASKHVWMCVESNIEWAIIHTVGKHKADVSEIVVFEIDVPRSWLTNHKLVIRGKGRRGFWKTDRKVEPARIKAVHDAVDFGKRD